MLMAVKDYSRLAIVASWVELILMLFSMDRFRYAEVIHIIKLTLLRTLLPYGYSYKAS